MGQGPQAEIDVEFSGGRAPLPIEQLEERARHLATGHGVTSKGGPRRELLERLDENTHRLEQIYRELSKSGLAEKAETPSEEWLRDNHYVVRAQVLEIRRNLPRRYYQELPTLT
jgi:cyclic beta-1,2-glucan glucanotransferase